MEAEAASALSKTEAKLLASSSNEIVLKQQVDSLRYIFSTLFCYYYSSNNIYIFILRLELSRLEAASKKAPTEDKGVQTDEPGQQDNRAAEVAPEKLSETALCVQEVRKQFQSAITASGDDWSRYLSASKI
jgi:hypothetical protein